MRTRIDFHKMLINETSCDHIYYQPPENLKLVYPCIIYSEEADRPDYADNVIYNNKVRYSVTYISKSADDTTKDLIHKIMYCAFDRSYKSDNLYHTTYTIYY